MAANLGSWSPLALGHPWPWPPLALGHQETSLAIRGHPWLLPLVILDFLTIPDIDPCASPLSLPPPTCLTCWWWTRLCQCQCQCQCQWTRLCQCRCQCQCQCQCTSSAISSAHQCTSTPAHQCTSAPVHYCAFAPVHQEIRCEHFVSAPSQYPQHQLAGQTKKLLKK